LQLTEHRAVTETGVIYQNTCVIGEKKIKK